MRSLRIALLTAAVLGLAAFVAVPSAAGSLTQPPPVPIPGGLQIPGGPLLHLFVPGPPTITLPFSGSTLMGLDVEPKTITDSRGFTALAYSAGTARDSEGNLYNLEADMRVFRGRYVAADGTRHRGLFVFI